MDNIIPFNITNNLAIAESIQSNDLISPLPDCIDFDVEFEPTKVSHKKYVVNAKTGDYLDTVGDKFNCASHPDFLSRVQETMIAELEPEHLVNATCDYRIARKNAWVLMDIKLPEVKVNITTHKGFNTDVSWRAIALHGIDGSCSNQVFFGGIENFCTNGQISGEWDKVRRKNTSGFVLAFFIDELRDARTAFYHHCKRLQAWADTSTNGYVVQQMLESLIPSERKAEKMLDLYYEEAAVRGANVYALYSAFTNYSTYADDRNGFGLRNTGHDTQAVSMWNREHEVSKWVSSNQFAQLLAA